MDYLEGLAFTIAAMTLFCLLCQIVLNIADKMD
jgi:hypothetical protein